MNQCTQCVQLQGWHVNGNALELTASDSSANTFFVSSVAPFLFRIYMLLQTGGVDLNCFSNPRSASYMSYVREQSDSASNSVKHAYTVLLDKVQLIEEEAIVSTCACIMHII